MITISSVDLEDHRAVDLWAQQQEELRIRYGDDEDSDEFTAIPHLEPGEFIASFLATLPDGEPVGTILLRWCPYDVPAGTAEAKRLYVKPAHRGNGYSRILMGAAERAAERAGAVRIVLETGTEQPEALALYDRIGFHRITPYGEYKEYPSTICYGRELPTRVLVINGTMGAGKTTIMGAAHTLLSDAGAHVAMIDADYLCQADPTPPDDRFNERLLFKNLTAIAPNYREAGMGLVIVARVIEDAGGRDQFARAFADATGAPSLATPPAGPAQVAVVRLEASEPTRQARLKEREPAAFYEGFAKHRTVELAESIAALDADDAIVVNDGRPAPDVAREVLDAVDW